MNIYAGKYEQNYNGYGLEIYEGGTLNATVDEFISNGVGCGIRVVGGKH